MAKRISPFAPIDKAAVIGALRAVGSHDPDILERERSDLVAIARLSWIAGAVLMFAGSWVCYSSLGIPAGIPLIVVATWLLQRGKRISRAVREGFAEFGNRPLA